MLSDCKKCCLASENPSWAAASNQTCSAIHKKVAEQHSVTFLANDWTKLLVNCRSELLDNTDQGCLPTLVEVAREHQIDVAGQLWIVVDNQLWVDVASQLWIVVDNQLWVDVDNQPNWELLDNCRSMLLTNCESMLITNWFQSCWSTLDRCYRSTLIWVANQLWLELVINCESVTYKY